MNLDRVKAIVDSVLYEGYMLYPYRPSSVKNRQRFNFGALAPHAYSLAQGGTEASVMQTECLVQGNVSCGLEVRIRFLQLVAREEALETGDPILPAWQEAIERDVELPDSSLGELAARAAHFEFSFPSNQQSEPVRDADGRIAVTILRSQESLAGAVDASAEAIGDNLFKLSVRISNLTPLEDANQRSRNDALMRSLVSTHTILGVRGGALLSLLDPPEAFREAAARCRNVGTWPVLVGNEGERDLMLSSPIILYDYPQIAPESAGDLFDGTEIDEILTLRILTLTEEEKREVRAGDARARRILERTETLPPEQMRKLHGAVRGLRPAKPERTRVPGDTP